MCLFLTAVLEGGFPGAQWWLMLLSCLTFCGFSILLEQEIEQLSPEDQNPTACFQKTHFFLFLFPQLSSALLFDAVYAVVSAVQELNRSQEIGVKPLSCGSAQIWQHGTSLMNYLRMVRAGSRERARSARAGTAFQHRASTSLKVALGMKGEEI